MSDPTQPGEPEEPWLAQARVLIAEADATSPVPSATGVRPRLLVGLGALLLALVLAVPFLLPDPPAPGPRGADAALAAVVAADPAAAGLTLLDPGAIGASAWLEIAELPGGGFEVVVVRGEGDCQAGCINLERRVWAVDAAGVARFVRTERR